MKRDTAGTIALPGVNVSGENRGAEYMKKQNHKGLVLSREIVRVIGDRELHAAVGGATGISVCHCPTSACGTTTTQPTSALC
jgi:hypothetical protein